MNAEPIGRQPNNAVITPSKPYPWYGGIIGGEVARGGFIVGGERFTREQQHEIRARGLGDDTENITVRRFATSREAWWPSRQAPPIFAFDCPIVTKRLAGQVDVISPSGMVKRVQHDGWISPPGQSKWRKSV